jgi:acyl transferase domain-containing protein/phosphopantetheinyl transferase (holo-ACP synthase)
MPVNSDSCEAVAIVGMACVFPGARDVAAFWRLIMRGQSAIGEVPASRWNPADYDVHATRGGFIDGLASFNPLSLGVMPSTVSQGDAEQFLVLAVAQAALLDAGLDHANEEYSEAFWARAAIVIGRGAYLGNAGEALYNRNEGAAAVFDALRKIAPDLSRNQNARVRELVSAAYPELSSEILASAIPNLTSGRIANRFGMMGANYTIDGACASSLLALDHIMRDLQTRRCDLGIAAGVHLCQKPHFWHAFEVLGALSPSGRCAPFDAAADGLLMGEGAGALVLKRHSDAVRDGDRIYATVRGVGVASDGRGAGLMAPRCEGQILALQCAYSEAGIDPRTISLLEAHGTGTPVGDRVELETLRAFYGERDAKSAVQKNNFAGIALGSVKSQIGHAMPAAGMAGLIKTALALHHRVLPPTISISRPHALLENSRLALNTWVRPLIAPFIPEEDCAVARAGVNAFGFGGINAHAILEAVPEVASTKTSARKTFYFSPRSAELLVFAAPSAEILRAQIGAWQARLGSRNDRDDDYLRDVARTALDELPDDLPENSTVRLAIAARDVEDLNGKFELALEHLDRGESTPRTSTGGLPHADDEGIFLSFETAPGKVAVLFPGLGFPGLAGGYTARLAELCVHFPAARACVEAAERATAELPDAQDEPPYPLRHQFFPAPHCTRAELDKIERELAWSQRTLYGMLAANRATWEVLKLFHVEPDFLAGFSLGEWSALMAAGTLDSENMGEFLRVSMQEINRRERDAGIEQGAWGMIARPPEEVEARFAEVKGTLAITMDTAPHQVFIGGESAAVAEIVAIFKAQGAWAQMMPFPAMHTPVVSDAVENLRARGAALQVHPPRAPVYQGSVGKPYPEEPSALRDTLFASLARPVHVRQTVAQLYEDGARIFLQLGSGAKILQNVRKTLGANRVRTISLDSDKRGGLAHLLYALAELWSAGVPMRLDALFENRPWRNLRETATTSTSSQILSLSPSRAHFSEPALDELRALLLPPSAPSNPIREYATGNGNGAMQEYSREELSPLGSALVEMQQTMRQFLEVQRADEVAETQMLTQFLESQSALAQFFTPETATASLQAEATEEINAAPSYPLLGELLRHTPERELVSRFVLDLDRHPFLRDHCLIRIPEALSTLRPLEERLPTLPMTAGLEMMAEAAATLWPNWKVVALKEIEARRWIALEDRSTLALRIDACTVQSAPHEIEVAVGLHPEYSDAESASGNSAAALVGRVVLRREFSIAPAPLEAILERECAHSVEEYYAGPLFHGPCFRVIKAFEKMSDEAIAAELEMAFPPDVLGEKLARGFAAPIFDLAFLDGLGQVPGYPVALDDWAVFPSRLQKLERFGENPPPGARVRVVVKYRRPDARRLVCDMDAFDESGKLWLRVEEWLDWRLLWPREFLSFEWTPHIWFVTTRVAQVETGTFQDTKIICRRVTQAQLNGVNPDWFARGYLRPREWRQYSQSPRLDWLLGRLAAKDALRDWLQTHRNIALHPLEIEIENNQSGAPRARFLTPALENVGLKISLAHLGDEAMAAAGTFDLGVDVAPIEARDAAWQNMAFSQNERRVLALSGDEKEWLHRGWCAKEAAAKMRGQGLESWPNFQVTRAEASSGEIEIFDAQNSQALRAQTWIEAGRAFALATLTEPEA